MVEGRVRIISEVLAALRPEFPDVTISKLRFLESQGLIHPKRNTSGYREFSDPDLERIRFILAEQRDNFLPLKVIKSKLTAWERGETPAGTLNINGALEPSTAWLNSDEMCRAAGLTRPELKALLEHDVLWTTADERGRDRFDALQLPVAEAARRLLAAGLEPRHLRSLRLSAGRTRELLIGLTAPLLRHPNPASRARAAEVLGECVAAAASLNAALLRSELTGWLGSEA